MKKPILVITVGLTIAFIISSVVASSAPGPLQPLQAGFAVTGLNLKANSRETSGPCPINVGFSGFITVNGPGEVRYKFIRSDAELGGQEFILKFKEAGTQPVVTSWSIGGDGRPSFAGWEAIQILSPNSQESNHALFNIACSATTARGRFRVTLQGFTVRQQTNDDLLERDGVGDEVYLANPTTFLFNRTGVESELVIGGSGIVYGQPRRLVLDEATAGTASATGGFRTGDEFPSPNPWSDHAIPTGLGIPHLLFDGEISQGINALAVIPSIWEFDHAGFRTFVGYRQSMGDPNLGLAVSRFITPSPGNIRDAIKTFSQLRLANRVSVAGGEVIDRPIGMAFDGEKFQFNPQVIILTYEMADIIASTDFGKGNGVLEMTYRDDPELGGNYSLYIKVVRLP